MKATLFLALLTTMTLARADVMASQGAGPPGLRGLRQCHELHTDRARAFRDAVQDILPVMVATGYDVIGRVDNELLVFERRDERVVVAFNESGDGGTRLVVHGTARRPVRKAFANLAVD